MQRTHTADARRAAGACSGLIQQTHGERLTHTECMERAEDTGNKRKPNRLPFFVVLALIVEDTGNKRKPNRLVTMANLADVIAMRRDLHRIPEIDFDVVETLAYVKARLESLIPACTLIEPCRSCVCAFFDRGSTQSVCIRAELDGLPIHEKTGLPFASQHEGRMHACAHDAHMAMALGLADDLAHGLLDTPSNVLIIFEPAEETTGGAQEIIASGILHEKNVQATFGIHLWPGFPPGACVTRSGVLLASSCETDVICTGRSAHIGHAEDGADALWCACSILQEASARIPLLVDSEGTPTLLRFGRIEAGEVRNQIADHAHLEGSLRAFDETLRDRAREALKDIASRRAQETGCSAHVHFSEGYPPLMCNKELVERAQATLNNLTILEKPLLMTDDFSYYCREGAGLFVLVGTGDTAPLHSSVFDFDESLLATGLDVLERLVQLV